MTLAALILSIVAVLVSVASAWFTRQQAKAAGAVSDIEHARRHDERTPAFDSEVRQTDDGKLWAICLRLTTPWPLSRVQAEIVEGQGIQFINLSRSIELQERLVHDQRIIWLLELEDTYSSTARLRLTCHEGTEKWTVPSAVKMPPNPQIHWID